MRDLFSIAGKTALVTGGSRGIGLMIARGFVEAGAKVYISSRKADVCDRAATELAKEWRTDKALRHLEALLLVADPNQTFLISGAGDVIEPDSGIAAIGSGGPFAQAASRPRARHCRLFQVNGSPPNHARRHVEGCRHEDRPDRAAAKGRGRSSRH